MTGTEINIAIGLATSFVGSFLALLIWIHWHLEDHWAERKERLEQERARYRYERGRGIENEERMRRGLPLEPDLPKRVSSHADYESRLARVPRLTKQERQKRLEAILAESKRLSQT